MRRLILLSAFCSMMFVQAASAATINVTSPNGGERWIEGGSYRIRWESTDVQKVTISLTMGGKDLGTIATVAAKNGLYYWTIPRGFVSDIGNNAGNNTMQVVVTDADPAMSDVFDNSDRNFSVVKALPPAPTSPPPSQQPPASGNTGLPQSGQATTAAILIAVLGGLITMRIATRKQKAL